MFLSLDYSLEIQKVKVVPVIGGFMFNLQVRFSKYILQNDEGNLAPVWKYIYFVKVSPPLNIFNEPWIEINMLKKM